MSWKAKIRNNWISTSCPFATITHEKGQDHNPSFGICIEPTSESHYNCMACGKKGSLSALPLVLENMEILSQDDADSLRAIISESESYSDKKESNEGYLVDRAPTLSEYNLERFQKVRKHQIKSRGILPDSVSQFDLMWDREENRLLFPIRDVEGRLVSIRGRYLGDAEKEGVLRYREYSELSPSRRSAKKFGVWYGDHLSQEPNKALILMEGEIDLIRFKQILPRANVKAAIGAGIAKEQIKSLLSNHLTSKGLVLFFDADMAGKKASEVVVKAVMNAGAMVPVYRVTEFHGCNDIDEIIIKGGKDLLIKSLQSLDKVY
jgi:DNA primase